MYSSHCMFEDSKVGRSSFFARLENWGCLIRAITLLEPIYISETVKKAMNPTFRHIDLSACSPGVTRLDHVIVRVWVKKSMAESQWKLLLELETALQRLQYLGKGVC